MMIALVTYLVVPDIQESKQALIIMRCLKHARRLHKNDQVGYARNHEGFFNVSDFHDKSIFK